MSRIRDAVVDRVATVLGRRPTRFTGR
jgi:hypothetical protein